MQKIILASASPQRTELLRGIGVKHTVHASTVDESSVAVSEPKSRAQILAKMKAEDVSKHHPGCIIIGCDTLVVSSDGTLLEKPSDKVDVEKMLRLQSGKTSTVHSALAVVDESGNLHEDISSSSVTFQSLSEEQISWWIASDLWKGRSGGFQIDGPGQLMISGIEGDWTGIVGLPIFLLGQLLRKAGFDMTKKTPL